MREFHFRHRSRGPQFICILSIVFLLRVGEAFLFVISLNLAPLSSGHTDQYRGRRGWDQRAPDLDAPPNEQLRSGRRRFLSGESPTRDFISLISVFSVPEAGLVPAEAVPIAEPHPEAGGRGEELAGEVRGRQGLDRGPSPATAKDLAASAPSQDAAASATASSGAASAAASSGTTSTTAANPPPTREPKEQKVAEQRRGSQREESGPSGSRQRRGSEAKET